MHGIVAGVVNVAVHTVVGWNIDVGVAVAIYGVAIVRNDEDSVVVR